MSATSLRHTAVVYGALYVPLLIVGLVLTYSNCLFSDSYYLPLVEMQRNSFIIMLGTSRREGTKSD